MDIFPEEKSRLSRQVKGIHNPKDLSLASIPINSITSFDEWSTEGRSTVRLNWSRATFSSSSNWNVVELYDTLGKLWKISFRWLQWLFKNTITFRFFKAWKPRQTNICFWSKLVSHLNKDLIHISGHPNAKARKVKLCSQWYFYNSFGSAISIAKATLFVCIHH